MKFSPHMLSKRVELIHQHVLLDAKTRRFHFGISKQWGAAIYLQKYGKGQQYVRTIKQNYAYLLEENCTNLEA